MSAATRTAPRPRTEEPEHHWSDLLFATVWLVFLVIPAAALLQSDEPIWARALGLLGLALFAGLYTVSWIRQILLPYLSVLGNAVLWCAVLLVPLTLLLPASPWGMAYTAPFFVAVCAFRLPLRQGILASLLIETAALVPLLMLLRPGGLRVLRQRVHAALRRDADRRPLHPHVWNRGHCPLSRDRR